MTMSGMNVYITIFCAITIVNAGAAMAGKLVAGEQIPNADREAKLDESQSPLARLPSPPIGKHLSKIRELGDNQWLDLGSPTADPKWGKARGRSFSSRAAYAPNIRGAFFFGEGPHGFVKPDGHYMDDLWVYDVNQHRWICVYPGINADEGYARIKLNEDGFETTPDGHPLPIASMVHGYSMITYDTDRNLFMSQPCDGGYWKASIKGRWEVYKKNKETFRSEFLSPWIYNTKTDHWERYKTRNQAGTSGFGATLVYVPSVKKAFAYRKRNGTIAWYDPDSRDWIPIARKGELPPWDIDFNSCYDSKRDRIYLGGGIYPIIDKGESALWMFDVKTETFARIEPKGAPTSTVYTTNRAMMNYDKVNDVVVLIQYVVDKNEGEVPGVYVYHPAKNEWETVSESPPAITEHVRFGTGFYSAEYNVHFLHRAGDGRDNGTMWAYRYRRASERG